MKNLHWTRDITVEELQLKVRLAKEKLLEQRNRRVRPGLDDKCLTAWNAMMIKGLADSANVFDEQRLL